ncbi:MAG: transporter substrate-binding domain-containing protein [Chloroflexi bacterium]|nr:transporter substrate-binding domain-containing protein [Chloroflexota bacterium]MCL5273697.1 transporter substrate-binding domain-containing protein [Chloroflexota bacterium]
MRLLYDKPVAARRCGRRHKILPAPILIVLTVALSGCSSLPQLSNIAAIVATPDSVYRAPTPTVAPAEVSTAALVKNRSKLRVGIRFDAPPLASVNSDGQLEGLDVDLAREFARRWLGSPDNVEFVQVTSASAPLRVQRREVDLALGGLVHTKAATEHADFGFTYLYDGEALLIRTGSFADFASLAQHTVTYVDVPTTYALSAAEVSNNITVSLQTAPSYEAAISQLTDGQTDAVAGVWRRLRAEAARDPALTVLTVFKSEPVAIMLPQNNSDWMTLVNVTFSALISDGAYARMYKKWFNAAPETLNPLPDTIDLQLASLPDTVYPHDTLSRIRANNRIHVGFNAQADPLATLDANGQAVGFEIDICRELASRWFQNPDAVDFTALPGGDIPGLLRNTAIDMAVGDIVQTQANSRLMDFSATTYRGGVGVAVLQTSGATTLESLSGKVFGVVQGKPDGSLLASVGKARNLAFSSSPFPDLSTALAALRNGQVDAVVDDQVTLLALARTANDVFVLPEQLSSQPVGIALPRDDSTFHTFVDLTLQDMFADGTYARIYKKWFGAQPADMELWPGQSTLNTVLVAPTATPLPTVTPVFNAIDTPKAPPPAPAPTATKKP